MLRPRHVLTCALLLALLALVLPVSALAGGSAGDQQYVDPLAHHPTHHSSTTTPAPAPATPATSTATSTTPAAPTTTTTPTATTAATTTSSHSAKTAKQLPYTGYDGRLAAGLGFVLVLGGVGLRRRAHRA